MQMLTFLVTHTEGTHAEETLYLWSTSPVLVTITIIAVRRRTATSSFILDAINQALHMAILSAMMSLTKAISIA